MSLLKRFGVGEGIVFIIGGSFVCVAMAGAVAWGVDFISAFLLEWLQ